MGNRPGEMVQMESPAVCEDPSADSQNPREKRAERCVPGIPAQSGGDR